ncbi:hypothetical protein LOD99_3359 [Oopsacas minuta]|uniref:Uncharacterized protein n=1 Tax=Oopsacas minuta TaxID=111878 RepID=A0AAV7JY66_9METZ|nr:hypothetical protein LOD99_3359 [Oopsacas minuta]
METKTKILILFLCFAIIVIGLLVGVAIAVGAWFIFRPASTFAININSPLPPDQAFSNGYIELELSLPTGIFTRGNVLVYLNGVQRYSYKFFPTNLQIPTQGLEDGTHIVTVEAQSTTNSNGVGEIIILVQDPSLMLISIDYPLQIYPGMQITITAEVSGDPSHFVANYTSIFGQPTIMNSTIIQNGSILIGTITIPSNIVAIERFHTIPLVIYSIDQRTLMVPGIEIFFQLGVTNPFTIAEGIIDMKSFPLTEASNTTNGTLNVTLPPSFEVSITTGQSVEVPLEISEDSTAIEILVGFEGFGQHFIIPISSLQSSTSRRSVRQANNGTIQLNFMVTLPSGSIESGDVTDMLIRLRDIVGELGEVIMIPIITSTSQTGTLHVRLTWDKEVDMDLHVVDPNNEEIYYASRISSAQEGFLDLDSNAGCNIDRIKTENVYYELAISGQYTIRVDLWSACSINETINFDILVEGCDVKEMVEGSFLPNEADGGGAGAGREVLVVNVNCHEFLAKGTVSYMTTMSRFNPLGSIVRVVDDAGNVYGTSQVERDVSDSRRGVYSLSYQPQDVDSTVYVEFLSSNNMIEVTDHSDVNIHVYRVTAGIIPSAEDTANRDVTITTADSSGAFHIMVTLTRMLPIYLSYGGEVTDYPRKADWENGKYAKGTNYPVSYFGGGVISIGGHVTDPDEFDDSVLLHEFGHLINARTGAVITGGGPHDGSPITPNFAFSEGYATYLGQKVLGNLMYCDGWCQDLSNLNANYLGTTALNDHSSGDISENLIASAAFKLDNDIGLGAMMCQSLTDPNKLLLEVNYNRLGTLDAVDFSDMVSIVVCPLDDDQKTMSTDLLNEYNLPWIVEESFCP